MPMTLAKVRKSVRLISKIAALFGASAVSACGEESLAVGQTELFGGEVSLCYDQPYARLMEGGLTGLPELDEAVSPDLNDLNAALRPYGRKLIATEGADKAYFKGGSGEWDHICEVELPDNAVFYRVFGDRNAPEPERVYPSVLRSVGPEQSVKVARWVADGRLVHVEIAVGEKAKMGNME